MLAGVGVYTYNFSLMHGWNYLIFSLTLLKERVWLARLVQIARLK
jgi:hypothetical protein